MKLNSLLGLFGGVSRWINQPDTEPTQEAKQQRLNKSAKVQTALEGLYVEQMGQIAKDEVAEVRQYKDQTVFGGKKKAPQRTDDEMLIADDIRITNVKSGSGILPTIAGLALGAAAVYFGMSHFAPSEPEPKPAETVTIETPGKTVTNEYDYSVDSRVIPPD